MGLLAVGALAALALAATSAPRKQRARRHAAGDDGGRVRTSIYWLSAYSFAMGAAGGSVTTYLPLYAHDAGHLRVAAAGGVMVLAGIVATVGRIAGTRWIELRVGVVQGLLLLALLATVSGSLLLAVPALGPGSLWLAAALWGASGLTFGSVGMLAVMAESDGANTGRASGLTVFGFGLGLTCTPPLFGLLTEHADGYGPGFALVTALYALAVVLIALGRGTFRSLEPQPVGEARPGQ